jgi:hypothetical protein
MFDCLVDVDSALNNSIKVKWYKDDQVGTTDDIWDRCYD